MLNSQFIHFSVRLGRGPVIPLVWFHLVSLSDAGQKTRAFQTEINKKKAWTIEAGQSAAKPTLTYHRADAGLLKRGILLVDTSWFSRGDMMCDAHQKLPSEAHLEHSALEVGDYCSLPPGDDESRALGLCISFKKQGDCLESSLRLFEIKVSCPGVDVSATHPRSPKPFDLLCAVLFFSLQINVCDFLFMFISSKISSTEK